jgi:hypothetical protein
MIKVCFPPGCYGSYLTRCIVNYTELNTNQVDNFDFDASGSSHIIGSNSATKLVYIGHLHQNPLRTFELPDSIITILPDKNHGLDYFNNQFVKQELGELVTYTLKHFPIEEINNKLTNHWHYSGQFDKNVPRWILREFVSMWITDTIASGYSFDAYNEVPAVLQITTQHIFTDYLKTIQMVSDALQLKLTVDNDTILKNHSKFLNAQRFHNSQLNCEEWVMDTINGADNLPCPSQTIFDESYIQYYFRLHGYEIQCNGLNDFPNTTTKMNKVIYKS